MNKDDIVLLARFFGALFLISTVIVIFLFTPPTLRESIWRSIYAVFTVSAGLLILFAKYESCIQMQTNFKLKHYQPFSCGF